MNLKLLFPLIAVVALVPVLIAHQGFNRSMAVGSGYTSDWQRDELNVRSECVIVADDLLRRAAPTISGAAVSGTLTQHAVTAGLAGRFACVNS